MVRPRVAVVFDVTIRRDTTGTHCLEALEQIAHATHFPPSEVHEIKMAEFDLVLNIDDGMQYRLPDNLHPCAFWSIDTHMDIDWQTTKAADFDLVFAAQRDGATKLREAGITTAEWLPLACNPFVHRPHDVPIEYDLCFIGNMFPGPRQEMIDLVCRRHKNVFVGQRYLDEMAVTYSASRIALNRSIKNDINMRVFEALACRSFLLTNDLRDNGLTEIFRDGVHLATFQDSEELLDKIAFYLARRDCCERIANTGQEEVLAKHTYQHRMARILDRTQEMHDSKESSIPVPSMKSKSAKKDSSYYQFPRPDLMALIPTTANRVLDIGCGSGGFGESLKTRQEAEVTGIERDPEAAACAKERLDHVILGDVEEMEFHFHENSFDCIVCGDVLEHLCDPVRMLRDVRAYLSPGGLLIASIPNVRHHSVVAALLAGNWSYEPSGLLDDTHLQFFTRRNIDQLFELSGYCISKTAIVPGPGYDQWHRAGRLGNVCVGPLMINGVAPEEAEEFFVYQYLVIARAQESVQNLSPSAGRQTHATKGAKGFEDPELNRESPGRVRCATIDKIKAPEEVLLRIRKELDTDERLLLTVPNVQHHRILSSLLDGDWHFAPGNHGAQAHGQLRFFTRREIEKLMYRTGYEVVKLSPVGDAGVVQSQKPEQDNKIQIGGLRIDGLTRDDAQDFYAEHYEIEARPLGVNEYQLTSIVILTHNQLAYTQKCLESIRFYTREPYELIVVDNGSSDGSVDYLRGQSDVKVVENNENLGFPAGCNQGIRASQGQQILLLNNDVIATTGWLDRMLRALHSAADVGLVGPCTNCISGPQQVPVTYTDLASLDGFAWEWAKTHDRMWQTTDRLVGFCLLFRRSLVDEIGLLDERFGIGNFEDDDFCRRAHHAGYRSVICRDCFVHHFGSATFRDVGLDFDKLLSDNEQLFHEKWTADVLDDRNTIANPEPRREHSEATPSNEKTHDLTDDSNINLSLCMIVRDSAATIEACLSSIQPWVDEMIVVDTGSQDETPEIAQRYGARVFHYPWPDSFAEARNESLRHARGRWIFWMDSDDTISPENGHKLSALANHPLDNQTLGFVMQVHCPGGCEGIDTEVTVVDHVKMVRNLPELRFEGRIHEQILASIRRLGGHVEWTDIHVIHSGADHTLAGRQAKWDRDLRLLRLELEDRPDHPFALFNLGMTLADKGEHQHAVEALKRSIAVSEPSESHVRKLYALLVCSCCALGRYEEAWENCSKGRDLYPDDPELLFREGLLAHRFGWLLEAERAYLQLLAHDGDERHFSSIDRGILGFKARHNLALVYMDMGQLIDAERQWWQVVEETPTFMTGWRELGKNLIRQARLDAADALADQLNMRELFAGEAILLRGLVANARGDHTQATSLLQEAAETVDDKNEALRTLCQHLFENGDVDDAQRALRQLVDLDPTDASAHHNLGTVLLRATHFGEAVDAFRSSLRIRPDAAETYLHLGYALNELQKNDEAEAAFRIACDLSPEDPRPHDALCHLTATIPADGN